MFEILNCLKKTLQKRARLVVPSKCLIIIKTLSLFVVCFDANPQQKIPNSPTKKLKNKATPIIHIVKTVINTP